MAKRTKKLSRPTLKLEALEQRQLLAGITGAGTEVGTDIHHSNGNVYDQVLLTGTSVKVTNDDNQVTRVSFLDLNGDIVQAEFSGKGTLTVALDSDTSKANQDPTGYNQTGVKYMQGLASFTIEGSDASTNFQVFSVGKGNAINQSLFDATHTGGDHFADVQRLTIVANTANPNGSVMGSIRAGDALFSGSSGVVGITAANVQVQNLVRIYDIDAKGTATPALTFGTQSQFGSVEVLGGDLVQTNLKAISNSDSYAYQLSSGANVDSAGNPITAKSLSSAVFTTPIGGNVTTLSLTTAIDNLTGTGGDDVINGSHTSNSLVVSALDKIDGGAGSDLLNIADSTGNATTDSSAQIDGLSVANVENFIYTSTGGLGSTNVLDTSGWTGLTSATLTLQDTKNAGSALDYTASKDTAVVINARSSGDTMGWDITGGSTVKLTDAASGVAGATGNVTVTGVQGTTSVDVTTSGKGSTGSVTVTDWATGNTDKGETGTIKTVTISGATGVTVDSNALTNLSLTKVGGAVEVKDELAGHKTAGTTLAIALNASTITTLKDTNATIKQIDFTNTGDTSKVSAYNNLGEVTTITVAGTKKLDLTNASGLGKLATVTSTNTAGLTIEVGNKVAVTTGDGNDVITASGGAAQKAISLGAGNDWVGVTLKSDGKTLDGATLDGGAGTDTLSITGLEAKTATAGITGLAAQISGFEVLEISDTVGNTGGTIDLHNLDDINQIVFKGNMVNDYTLDKLASGTALTYSKTQGGNGTINIPVAAVQNETLAVTLSSSNANVDAKQLTATNVNTVNLTAIDTHDAPKTAVDNVSLVGPKTVNISGEVAQLTVNTGTASVVNASAMAGGTLVLTSTGGDGTVITGTSKGINDITATSGKVTVTTGSDQNDTVHVAAGSTVNAGDGDNQVFGSGAGNSITTGKGNDIIDLTAVTSGTSTISAGDGNDVIKIEGAAISNITLGGGDDKVVIQSVAGGSKSGYFASITGAGNADSIDIGVGTNGTVAKGAAISLGQGASFSDYVEAATAGNNGVGNGSEVNWFTYNGDTYIVVDNSDGGYKPGVDAVVRLTGSVKLSTMGVSAGGIITIGAQ